MSESTAAKSLDEVREWLVARVADLLRRPVGDIAPDVPLTDYGLDSVYALTVTTEIEDDLGVIMPPTVMWDNETIEELSHAVYEALTEVSAQ